MCAVEDAVGDAVAFAVAASNAVATISAKRADSLAALAATLAAFATSMAPSTLNPYFTASATAGADLSNTSLADAVAAATVSATVTGPEEKERGTTIVVSTVRPKRVDASSASPSAREGVTVIQLPKPFLAILVGLVSEGAFRVVTAGVAERPPTAVGRRGTAATTLVVQGRLVLIEKSFALTWVDISPADCTGLSTASSVSVASADVSDVLIRG